jgi:hypothetical protein
LKAATSIETTHMENQEYAVADCRIWNKIKAKEGHKKY